MDNIFDLLDKGNFKQLGEAVKNGANLEAINRSGYTSLQVAAIKGDLEIVKELLKVGANVNGIGERHKSNF